MERPHKRRRTVACDPDVELGEQRARCDKKLKSRFESIFAKYEKDFDGIGDEIDLVTGEIVVDNGHVENMVDEIDPGEEAISGDDEEVTSTDEESEEGATRVVPDSQDLETSDDDDPLGVLEDVITSTASRLKQGHTLRFSQYRNNASRASNSGMCTSVPSSRQRYRSGAIEEAWRVPPLPADFVKKPALPSPSPSNTDDSESARSASPPGISVWALPKNRHPRQNRSSVPDLPRQEKNPTASPRSSGKGRIWTADERSLLRHMKTSTSKSFVQMQPNFPDRSPLALYQQWWKQSRESDETPTKDGERRTNLAEIPNPKMIEPRREADQEPISNETSSSEASSDPASSPDLGECENRHISVTRSPTISISTQKGLEEHQATTNRFPSGTVLPDSQSDAGTQSQRTDPTEPSRRLSKPANDSATSRDEEGYIGRSKGPCSTRFAAVVLPDLSTNGNLQSRNKMLQTPTISQHGNRQQRSSKPRRDLRALHDPSLKRPSNPNEPDACMTPKSQDFNRLIKADHCQRLGRSSDKVTGDQGSAVKSVSQMDHRSPPMDDPKLPITTALDHPMKRIGSSRGTQSPHEALVDCSEQDDTLHEAREWSQGPAIEHKIPDSEDCLQSCQQHKEQPLNAAAGESTERLLVNAGTASDPCLPVDSTTGFTALEGSTNAPLNNAGGRQAFTEQAKTSIRQRRNSQDIPLLPTEMPNDNRTIMGVYQHSLPKTPSTGLSVRPAGQDRNGNRIVRSQIHLSPPSPTLVQSSTTQQAGKKPETPQTASRVPAGPLRNQPSSLKGTRSTMEIKLEPHRLAESDEDELECFVKPVFATKFREDRRQSDHGSATRLAFRPRIEDRDISDDELYTPPRVLGRCVEMTPVRSSMGSKRRVSSLV
ncbi:MAG: hypothetical protein Q9222_005944 [Ikaeria aurantiellina]